MDLSGELMQVDLLALGADFSILVFMIHGEYELAAPPKVAKSYFDSIRATKKELYLVPGTGHEGSAAEREPELSVLTEQVLPLTREHSARADRRTFEIHNKRWASS